MKLPICRNPSSPLTQPFIRTKNDIGSDGTLRAEEIVLENKLDYALLSLLVKWNLISICNLPVWSIMFIVE